MNSDEALDALAVTLDQLRRLLPDNKATWDREVVVRLAVERLWIIAGNLAEEYRIPVGIPAGAEPWSELAGYRHLLAHAPSLVTSPRIGCSRTAPPILIES